MLYIVDSELSQLYLTAIFSLFHNTAEINAIARQSNY